MMSIPHESLFHPPASTTLSDPVTYSGMFSRMVKTLYRSRELGTLARGDRSHGDRARAALDSLARTVSTLLRPSCAAARAADVRARRVQRQRSEVDAGDVGPCHGPDHLSRLSAFHHARGLGRRPDLATAPRDTARAPRRVDDRRAVVSPETLAQRRRPARGGADSDGRLLPGEMASGPDVDPPRARR